jgi:glyoxylase-like metal-dependent hydrolase (beta-lactamase superfamily II)
MRILKRLLVLIGGLVLVSALGVAALVASALWGNAPLPDAADLPGGIRLVKVNDAMVALFVLPAGGSSVALVDCGNDPDAKLILAELARRNARREDVKAIFLTHGHWDHTAGCHQFPGADLMALAPDVGLAAGIESGRGLLSRFLRTSPAKAAKVTRVLQDGETVQVGALTVRVFAIPGHTDGSAAFLANGVLFLGDSATDRNDGTFAGAARPFSNSVEQNHASLRGLWRRLKQEKLAVEILAAGHCATAGHRGVRGIRQRC